MGAISATDIISIIQGEIENINWDEESRETGEVIWVGDGIVTVYGIDHAMYGEIVAFENGVKGMVQDVRQNEIGIFFLVVTPESKKEPKWFVPRRKPVFQSVMHLWAE